MSNFLRCTWDFLRTEFNWSTVISTDAQQGGRCESAFYYLSTWKPFMQDVFVILVTLGTFAAVTASYLALNPTVFLDSPIGHNQCPDQWVYRDEDSMCHPLYQTECVPFNPEVLKVDRCQIAKNCGTTWKGLCD